MGADSIYGTLNLLILRTLAVEASHGLGVRDAIERLTDGDLSVEVGALYPALHRLHRDGLVSAEWGRSEKGRPAKVYTITTKGRAALADEVRAWHRHVAAIAAVVGQATP